MIDNDTKAKQGVKADYEMCFTYVVGDKRKPIYEALASERKLRLDLQDSNETLSEENARLKGLKGWRYYWENLTPSQATAIRAISSSGVVVTILTIIFLQLSEMGSAAKKNCRAKNCGEVLTDSRW